MKYMEPESLKLKWQSLITITVAHLDVALAGIPLRKIEFQRLVECMVDLARYQDTGTRR